MTKPEPFGWILVAKGTASVATIKDAVLQKVLSSQAAALAEAHWLWEFNSGIKKNDELALLAEEPGNWEKIRDEWVVNNYEVRPIYMIDDAAVTVIKHVQNSMEVLEMMDKLSTAMQMPKGRIND